MEEFEPGWLGHVIDRASRHLESLPDSSKPSWMRDPDLSASSPSPDRGLSTKPQESSPAGSSP